VLAALEDLDEIDREILALRHFEGLSNEEAAAELAIEPAAASKRFVRALADTSNPRSSGDTNRAVATHAATAAHGARRALGELRRRRVSLP
jgi:hypothetical protein